MHNSKKSCTFAVEMKTNTTMNTIKRNSLFAIVAACTLFLLGGCNGKHLDNGFANSNQSDLQLFDLTGDVHTVKYFYTVGVNSYGKKTSRSFNWAQGTYTFDANGRLTSAEESGEKIHISRNNNGQIDTLYIPCEKDNDEWNDGGYGSVYIWDDKGCLIREEYGNCVGTHYNRTYIYNDSSKIVGAVNSYAAEGDEWGEVHSYKVLQTDKHGNWTKRLIVIVPDVDFSDVQFELEERKIMYY